MLKILTLGAVLFMANISPCTAQSSPPVVTAVADSRTLAISADARRYPEALAQFIQNGMNEPVPIATHNRYLGMHNLFFQKKNVVMDASIGYNSDTEMIDIVESGEVLVHGYIFNPYSTFWLIAVALLVLPALNAAYRTGQKLGTVWGAAMIPTMLATSDCFVTYVCADPATNTGYLVATLLMSLAIISGGTARAAAEKHEAAWPYAGTYGALMLAALIAFVVPY